MRADAANLADIDRLYDDVKVKADRVLMLNAHFYEQAKLDAVTEEHFDNTYKDQRQRLVLRLPEGVAPAAEGALP